MVLTIVSESGRTGYDEMSVFHAFDAGNTAHEPTVGVGPGATPDPVVAAEVASAALVATETVATAVVATVVVAADVVAGVFVPDVAAAVEFADELVAVVADVVVPPTEAVVSVVEFEAGPLPPNDVVDVEPPDPFPPVPVAGFPVHAAKTAALAMT